MTPEVHVEVNIVPPVPGTGESYTVNAKTHSGGERCPPSPSPDTPSDLTPRTPYRRTPRQSNPNIRVLLQLMDIDEPETDWKYVSAEPDLVAKGLTGIREVYTTPPESLALVGDLGIDRAYALHAYIRYNVWPVVEPMKEGHEISVKCEGGGLEGGDCGVAACGTEGKGKGRLVKEESRDVLVEWPGQDQMGEDEIEEAEGMELPPIETLSDNDEDNFGSGDDTL